ncbi:MAG: DUF4270 family protein [Paludibacteraceae bacterium]|nr:DUF4270 family protein [Paludibacteraceae bacterium]
MTACKDDVANTGQSVLDPSDEIIVLADTFAFSSNVISCKAITSQADSFLLGEIETDYGVLRGAILTQLACPEGYHYPSGENIKNVGLDSICLFMYYTTWVGDGNAPLAINAYLMDRNTFRYSGKYPTDLNISDYCSMDHSILTNHRIVVANEKLDSVQSSTGTYVPMVRMRVNDDFADYFWRIQSFESQESFNEQFKGLLIETSFGSSTMLNVSDIALGVFYHFEYEKTPGNDTLVSDMKAFYANSEVRTVNHLFYEDKTQLVETLANDSDTYNYIIAPAGVYTRMSFPMEQIGDTIMQHMIYDSLLYAEKDSMAYLIKRPYVNKAEVRVSVENKDNETGRNAWLQPADYMLLIKESSMERFFKNKELPTDTCALLSALTQGVDSVGNAIYYYTYDLSDFLTNQLRKGSEGDKETTLEMLLVPVTIETSATSSTTAAVSSVRQQQTMSATKIRSAYNGMQLELIYCGF